jgi:hypothetical protein
MTPTVPPALWPAIKQEHSEAQCQITLRTSHQPLSALRATLTSNVSTTGVLLGTRNRLRNKGAHLRLRADYIAGDNQFDPPV